MHGRRVRENAAAILMNITTLKRNGKGMRYLRDIRNGKVFKGLHRAT
jgi:hypothetical protein